MAWAMLNVVAGERASRTQKISEAIEKAAEEFKEAQKKRAVQAAVAAVAKSEKARA